MLTVEWPTDKTLQFVQEYKNRPVLWNREHPHFRINSRKTKAWAEMAAIFNLDEWELKKKMNSLLASYRRERHKCRAHSARSKATPFTSNWFAYNAFAFLKDKYLERKNYSQILINEDDQEESADIEITEEETQIIDFVKTEDTETQNPLADDEDLTILDDVEEQSYAEDYQGPSSKRPKKEEIEPSYGGQESSSSHRSDRDENDIFGEYVSGKMRTFDHKTKCIVQYLMGNILFQADMGKFKGDTVNCDEIMTSLLKLFSKNGNNSKSAGCERSSNSRL